MTSLETPSGPVAVTVTSWTATLTFKSVCQDEPRPLGKAVIHPAPAAGIVTEYVNRQYAASSLPKTPTSY